MKKMKSSDKKIYSLIKVLGIIEIVLLSYFIIFSVNDLMNTEEFAEALINKGIYDQFYNFENIFSIIAFPIIIIIVFTIIPYLLTVIIIIVLFIRKYIKFKGEKRNQIIKSAALFILTILFVLKGIFLMPVGYNYEISINKNANEILEPDIKNFLQENDVGDKYIYKIKFIEELSMAYNVKIYYKDGKCKKIKKTSLSKMYNFLLMHSKNTTNETTIKAIILALIVDVLSIYFLVYILKEFKRISSEDY